MPYTQEYLIRNLKCSETEAEDFLLAQSKFFAVSFEPQEYKKLGLFDCVPFLVDTNTSRRKSGYGTVEKVFEGDKPFARKTISNDNKLEAIMMEITILELATDTGNPNLVQLRCAYEQNNHTCLVMYPWCEIDLSTFLKSSNKSLWWTRTVMACLASGLSALHKKNIKHQDVKPENVLLNEKHMPIICDFGLSKVFHTNSKSVKFEGTRAYLPPNSSPGKLEEREIFSLWL